jgi:hypothetical protein
MLVELRASTKAIGVASPSTLEFKSQNEQPIVTTKSTSPIKGEASLEFIPFFFTHVDYC